MYCVYSSLETDSPIMLINQHIGYNDEDGQGISGADFQRELLELDSKGYKSIQVWINSPGGSVMDGYAIYNSILKSKTPVDTYGVGMVASIAAVIFEAGRKRVLSDYARLFFHNPSGSDNKKEFNAIKGSLVTMIASRSKKSEQEISDIMDKTSFITPEDALDAGLCDSIEVSKEQNIKYSKNYWSSVNNVINSILKIENNMETNVQAKAISLSLIANYLGLNSEATEHSILTEVKNRINAETLAKEKAEAKVKDVTNALEKRNGEYDALNVKYDAKAKELTDLQNKIKDEKEAADKKIKDAETAAAMVKAEAMVKGHAEAGRIKNDAETISKWTNKATTDFEGVDELLKGLPVNKAAVHINANSNATGDQADPSKVGMNAAVLMAGIQNNIKNKHKA